MAVPGLRVTGTIPNGAEVLSRVDLAVGEVVTKLRPEVVGTYRTRAPGRIAALVKARLDKRVGYHLVISIAGGSILQPAAYWTNYGTGVYGPSRAPIRRRSGRGRHRGFDGRFRADTGPRPPFRLPGGRFVESFQGQKAQHWAQDARRQADAIADVVIGHQLDPEISAMLRRGLL